MNALTSVSKRNILALLLAFVASGANAEEIQPDADASQSVAGSDRSDVADTTQSVLSVDGDQMHADISDFFDRRWADRLLPAALTFGVMSLAPALLLMTTCFVRMSVVLSLTRQAIGTVNLLQPKLLRRWRCFCPRL